MKIGIVGAHGTGKSTLSAGLSRALDLPLIEEQARVVAKLGFSLDHGTTFAAQVAMMTMQLLEESRHESFVADRTLMDMCVYSSSHSSRFTEEENHALSLISNAMKELMVGRYDILFYTPILFPLRADGVRATDLSYQRHIDTEFQRLFRVWNITVIALPEKRRVERALDHLAKVSAASG
jgi:nicotinamide riboside kinase